MVFGFGARREALIALATQRGWQFRRDAPEMADRFCGEPLGRGTSRLARHLITGQESGWAFEAFDYQFLTGVSSSKALSAHTVLATPLGVHAPMLSVRPQGALGRAARGVFGSGLVIGDPDFDAAFLVGTDHEEFAREMLHPAMRATCRAADPHWSWRTDGDLLVLWRQGSMTVGDLEIGLATRGAVLQAVPPAVWARLRAGS